MITELRSEAHANPALTGAKAALLAIYEKMRPYRFGPYSAFSGGGKRRQTSDAAENPAGG